MPWFRRAQSSAPSGVPRLELQELDAQLARQGKLVTGELLEFGVGDLAHSGSPVGRAAPS